MTHHHSPFAGDNSGGADDGDERQGRWLTGTEALLAQAFPVHHGIHKGLHLCCFNVPAKSEDGPSFQRVSRVMRQQAGNSMNLFAMTVQYLYLLLYVKARVLRLDLYQGSGSSDSGDCIKNIQYCSNASSAITAS